MAREIAKRVYKETLASTVREITAHMFDHFLSGIITLFVAHQITIIMIIQLGVISICVVLLLRVVRNQDEALDEALDKQPVITHEENNHHDYSI